MPGAHQKIIIKTKKSWNSISLNKLSWWNFKCPEITNSGI